MPKLTEAIIEKAKKDGPPAGKPYVMLWDSSLPGFGLKLRANGSCSWLLVYRPKAHARGTNARFITLGRWPAVSRNDALTAARARMGEIAMGRDPAAEVQAERTRDRRLVPAVLDAYEADCIRRRVAKVKDKMSSLRRGLEPLFTMELDKLTRADIVTQIDKIEADGRPGAAMDLRKHTSAMFEFAVGKGLAPFNPMAGLRRSRQTRAEKLEAEETGRALSDQEIARVWSAAGAMGPFGGLVRLGLLSGLRRSELAGLRWSDITDDRIVLHGSGTKTGAHHAVPLTTAMKGIISAQMRQHGSDFVFGSQRAVGAKLSGWSKFVATLNKASKVNFRLHDLRRTCRTLMSANGISTDVAEMSIGHQRAELLRIYDRHDAWKERTKAFEAVSAHVSAAIATTPGEPADSNAVVQLPKRRKARAA